MRELGLEMGELPAFVLVGYGLWDVDLMGEWNYWLASVD